MLHDSVDPGAAALLSVMSASGAGRARRRPCSCRYHVIACVSQHLLGMDLNMSHFDVIVVGVGAMGSATCYHLARLGKRVLGLEKFEIPHAMGSSGGYTRIIRSSVYEKPGYVPLVRDAFKWWRQLESESGESLLTVTGGLYLGEQRGALLPGSKRAADEHGLTYEQLSESALKKRYPMFALPAGTEGFFEHEAGFLRPERCISVMVNGALRRGAVIRGLSPMIDWETDGSRATVRTKDGSYTADQIVFTSGAWSDKLVADLGVQLRVTRQVQGWIAPKDPSRFAPGVFPAWIYEHPDTDNEHHYGFPLVSDQVGLKVAKHDRVNECDPDVIDRTPTDADRATFWGPVSRLLPDACGSLIAMKVCMYTNTPDKTAIVDRHPQLRNVVVSAGFSGHGFKYASAVGRMVADLVIDDASDLPLDMFKLSRFATTAAG